MVIFRPKLLTSFDEANNENYYLIDFCEVSLVSQTTFWINIEYCNGEGYIVLKIMESGVRDVNTGQNVTVVSPVNVYGCELKDDVFIGPFVEIQKGCVIGQGSRIQSHTFICENVTLGQNCFIGHNVTFANDLFHSGSPDPSSENWIVITLGDNVTVGSGATILSTFICSGTVIGAGAVVTKPIKIKGIYAGNPARLIRTL